LPDRQRAAAQDDGRFLLETSRGTRFLTRTVIIAAGVAPSSRAG